MTNSRRTRAGGLSILRQIVEQSPVPALAVDPERQVLATNTLGLVVPEDLWDKAFKGETVDTPYARVFPVTNDEGVIIGAVYTARLASSVDQHFRQILDAAQVGMFEINLVSGVVIRSNTIDRIYGFPPHSPPEKVNDYLRKVHPDDQDRIRKVLSEIETTREYVQTDYRIIRDDGEVRFLSAWCRSLPDESGKITCAAGAVLDFTERHRAERRFEEIVDASTIGILIGDTSGVLRFANQTACQLLGYELADFQQGKITWQQLTPPEWAEADLEATRQLRDQGSCTPFEKEYLRRDGSRAPILIGATVLTPYASGQTETVAYIVDLTQLKLAQSALLQSELLYRSLFNSFPAGITLIDDRACIVNCNDLAALNLGYTREELIGKTIFEVEIGRPPDQIYASFQRLGESSDPIQFETKQRTRTGGIRDVLITTSGVRLSGRLHAFSVWVDVTDLKQIESELRAAELRLTLTQRSAGAGIYEADLATGTVTVSAELERLVGIPIGSFSGTVPDVLKYVHPEDVPAVRGKMRNRIRKKLQETRIEFRVIRPDGVCRFMELRDRLLSDSVGNPVRLIGSVLDTTDRKAAERLLRESEMLFRALADAMPQLVWMAHPDGTIFWFNLRWFTYTGTTMEQVSGWGWQSVLEPGELSTTLELFRNGIASAEPMELIIPLRRADGQFRRFLTRAIPLKGEAGEVLRWIGTNTDIEDQKQVEEALRRSNEDLQQFAYLASHDLQEPLRTLANISQLLERQYKGKLDARADKYLDFLNSGSQRMANLIRDLLTFSSVKASSDLGSSPFSLNAALNQVLVNLDQMIRETRAIIERDDLPEIQGDAIHFVLVLQNLVSNAIKYRKPGQRPEIAIRAERKGREWVISVKDKGIGFHSEYSLQIFGIFKRLHRDAYPGTGVGLAICKTVVERHGGQIWAESNEGEGASFFFTVPAAD